MTNPSYPDALPALSRLHWYVVERVLGQGGFGITYLARDTNLDQTVAIKEYLPVEVATRMPDGTIRSRTDDQRDRYRWGLERFIQEARTLARFDHPNIVRVLSVFEFNGTAYMVMRFEKGETLAALLDRRGTLQEAELVRIIMPVLSGLELVHNGGFIHRDIKPDNIHIGENGNPVLLDFGSARQALGSAHTLTILVAPGYAPFEQYYSDSASQGPWTDIYGLGATCYRAIAGRPPLDAVSRSKGILGSTQDVMVPASVIGAGRYTGAFLAAIDHALAFAERDRPQSIAEWRHELSQENAAPPGSSNGATRPSIARWPATAPRVTGTSNAAGTPTVIAAENETSITAAPSRTSTPRDRPAARGRTAAIAVIGATIGVIGTAAYIVMTQKSSELTTENAALKRQLAERKLSEPATETKEPNAKESGAKQLGETIAPAPPPVATSRIEEPKTTMETAVGRAYPEPKRVDESKRSEAKQKSVVLARAEPTRARAPISAPLLQAEEKKPSAPEIAPQPAPVSETTPTIAAKNYANALAALKPLADAGNAQAQQRLGNMSADGLGVTRDFAAAEKWLEKAALQGNTEAQLKLGAMYETGTGLARNNNLAYMWYGIAAGLGSSSAKSAQDRVASMLQPAERAQADRSIESTLGRMKKR